MSKRPSRTSLFITAGVIFSLPLLAQRPTENIGGRPVAAQQVLVKFRAPTAALIQAFQQLFDADDTRQVGGASGPYVFHSKSKGAATLLALMTGHSEASYVEPDYIMHMSAVPNDPSFSQLWGLKNTSTLGADISAVSAWDISTGSTANAVGVVDTGIDYRHPDLAGNVWTAPTSFTVTLSTGTITCAAGTHGYNAIAHICDPLDDNGHGTHVSGTIGAVGNNATGVTGVNWTAKILGLKFLDSTGSGAVSDAIDAIEFAIQVKAVFAASSTPVNVRVLSNSWGGTGFSQALLDEINKANTNNILFVAAAGNSSTNLDTTGTPTYPAAYNAANLVTVAATDSNDLLASFSNYGKNTVHLGAPGVSILSTYPNSSYAYLSGTSMATPHVSGSAALVLSACPTLNTASLKTTLLNNVDALSSLAAITVSGGRLNVNKAIRSCAPTSSGSSFWAPSATPVTPWLNDSPVTLGVKFRSDVTGTVTGIRFYKGAGNNGTHIGLLYTSTGTLLAQATFSGESSSGWQQVTFSSPVSIAANTTYIAAYFTTSGFADDMNYFTSTGIDNAPLHVLRSGVDGPNGVYMYGGSPQFPSQSWQNSNYWVDIAFTAGGTAPPPTSATSIWGSSVTPGNSWVNDSQAVTLGMKFRSDVAGTVTGIRIYKGLGNNGTHIGLLYSSTGTLLAQATFSGETASGWQQVNFSSAVSIAANTTYVAAYFTTSGYADDMNYFTSTGIDNTPLHALRAGVDGANGVYMYGGSPQFPSQTWLNSNYWVDIAFTAGGTAPPVGSATSVWSSSATPVNPWLNDPTPVTLGMKFRSDVAGKITGIRFYKGVGNSGTHIGLLYNSTGTLLAQATFSGETASGWQQVNFSSAVSIAANTTYIAAYFTSSGFADDQNFFASTGVDNSPLHALRSGVDGPNSVYMYAATPQFPNQTWLSSNYWVDFVFSTP